MPGTPTGGDLLAKALGGGAAHSELGYRGPSAKHRESGESIESFSAKLYGRDEKDLFKGRWDETFKDDELSDRGIPRRGTADAHVVKVSKLLEKTFGKLSGPNFLLKSFLPGLTAGAKDGGVQGLDGAVDELMPHDMLQAGKLPHPETFVHGGFESVKGTNVGSAQNAIDTYDQGYMPDEDYGQYQKEKDVRRAMGKLEQKKKTAALLVKVGLAAPPASAGAGYGDIPNGPDDINADQDLKRTTGPYEAGPTKHVRRNRVTNTPLAKAAEANTAPGSAASTSAAQTNFKMVSKPLKDQSKPSDSGVKQTSKARRSYSDALKVRPYTEGVQTAYQMLGPPGLDPQFPQAKTASLLRKIGFC